MSVETVLWREDATGIADARQAGRGDAGRTRRCGDRARRADAARYQRHRRKALRQGARRAPRSIDRSLPLAGVPFAIKDLGIAIEGRAEPWRQPRAGIRSRFQLGPHRALSRGRAEPDRHQHDAGIRAEAGHRIRRPSASPATRGTPATRPAARRAARRRWSPPAWCRPLMPPTAAARSACPRPAAAWSA